MHQSIRILLLLFIPIFNFSCGQSAENQHKQEQKQEEQSQKTSKEEEKPQEDKELRLNNGQRWVANPETTNGINNMSVLIQDFAEHDDREAYRILKDALESEFMLIFKNCTMKGEAHNQLHNYLLPIKAQFDQMDEADLNGNKLIVVELRKLLSDYNTYFE